MCADGCAIAEHGPIDNRLTVDGVGHRLAHAQVVKGGLFVVGGQDRFPLCRANEDLEAGVCLELGQVFRGREAAEDIYILGHHGGKGGSGIRDEFERGLVEGRGRAPIAVIAAHLDPVALVPQIEFERAGADGGLFDVLDAFGGHDDRIAPGEVKEHVAVGFRERDRDGLGAVDRDAADRGIKPLLGVGAVLGQDAIKAEFHIVGVHCGAVMESNAAA
mmetsp:Transcript_29412/g.57477  ORF Transcript_29412/g.57477 Transcript_29412/m.57477 type:complete len:218 (+) Transcript_29412:2579-3232(+)